MQLNKDAFNIILHIFVLVPKFLLRNFITSCPLNHSSFKFFNIFFFFFSPVCGTSIIATASRCVKTQRYKNRRLALNSFVWWSSGWNRSRVIPYIGHGRSGSCSQSLHWVTTLLWPSSGRAYVQTWVPKLQFEVLITASLVTRKTTKAVLQPSICLWPLT